jgi:colanic acid/amylovoran biosynthesis glycosyltransferase
MLFQAVTLGKCLGASRSTCAAIMMLKKCSYDIVHCQFGPTGLKALALRDTGLLRGKLVTSFRGFDATKYPVGSDSRVYDALFRRGDLFLAVSQHIRNHLIKLGCDEKKILVHRSAIDSSKFRFSPRKLEDTDEVRLVTIARLVEKKGLEYAIRAVAGLMSQTKKIRYQIIGDGMLRKDLQRLIGELGIGDVVRLVGWKTHDEVVKILDHSHIYISPSVTAKTGDQEGIPNGLKEAMAMGLPVIATKHAGTPELVTEGVSGFLIPERDVHSLAERITYLIENTEIWPEMGRAARAVVEDQYDVNRLGDELVEIYRGLLRQ